MDTFFVEGWVVVGGYQHVIHIYDEPPFSEFLFEQGIHHYLKGCWGVSKTKEHNHQLG